MSSPLCAAASTPARFVHPPSTFSELLRHPLGPPLVLTRLERTPHGAAVNCWMDLEQMTTGRTTTHGGATLTTAQMKRVEASVVARLRASLIRKHREVSRAVHAHHHQPRKGNDQQSTPASVQESDEPLSEDDGDRSGGEETSAERQAMKAAAAQFVSPAAATPVRPAVQPSADTDLLLDVIQLQLVDGAADGSEQPSTVALRLGEAGEEFALHSYADQLTRHLLTRLPQMQAHLEAVLSDVYWKSISESKEFDALVKAGPPTPQSIAAAAASSTRALSAAEQAIPAFDAANTKLVVTYLRKSDDGAPIAAGHNHHRGESPATTTTSDHGPAQSRTSAATTTPASSSSSSSSRGTWIRHTFYFGDLPTGVLVIGRSEHADITLPDSGVSRTHARLVWTPLVQGEAPTGKPTLRYTDFDTTYGSKLDGVPVTSGLLQVGHVVTLGKHCRLAILRCDAQDDEKRAREKATAMGATEKPADKESKCAIQ